MLKSTEAPGQFDVTLKLSGAEKVERSQILGFQELLQAQQNGWCVEEKRIVWLCTKDICIGIIADRETIAVCDSKAHFFVEELIAYLNKKFYAAD